MLRQIIEKLNKDGRRGIVGSPLQSILTQLTIALDDALHQFKIKRYKTSLRFFRVFKDTIVFVLKNVGSYIGNKPMKDYSKLIAVNLLKEEKTSITGHEMYKRARAGGHDTLTQEDYDYLFEHQELIPEEWKKYYGVYFWGTVFSVSVGGDLYVRSLYWDRRQWNRHCGWLGNGWDERNSSASLASSLPSTPSLSLESLDQRVSALEKTLQGKKKKEMKKPITVGQYHIRYIGDIFKKVFGRTKCAPKKFDIQTRKLPRNMNNKEILEELKPSEITLDEFVYALGVIKKQWTIFYIRDTEGILWAVRAYWDGDAWRVGAHSFEDLGDWDAGNLVCSYRFSDTLDSESLKLTTSDPFPSELIINGVTYQKKLK